MFSSCMRAGETRVLLRHASKVSNQSRDKAGEEEKWRYIDEESTCLLYLSGVNFPLVS